MGRRDGEGVVSRPGQLPDLDLLLAGYAVAFAIRAEVPSVQMRRSVRAATWNVDIESARERVAARLGERVGDAAWQRGKVEAWSIFADEQRGIWPREDDC